jgi:hypothetical protein
MSTIAGLFEHLSSAQMVIQDLVAHDFPREAISLVARDPHGIYVTPRQQSMRGSIQPGKPTSTTTSGGRLDGVVGLLRTGVVLTFPGFGPVLMAGSLATASGGLSSGNVTAAESKTVSGDLTGALVNTGIPRQEAHQYTDGIRRKYALVLVTTSEDLEDTARTLMREAGMVAVDTTAWGHYAGEYVAPGEEHHEHTDQKHPEEQEHANAATGALVGASRGAASGAGGTAVGAAMGAAEPYDEEWKESSTVGTTVGAVAGAAAGAAAGLPGGPPGVVAGGAVGSATGAAVGAAGDIVGKRTTEDDDTSQTDAPEEERTREEQNQKK